MARAWQLVIKASANDREAKRALRSLGREANQVQRQMGNAFGKIAKAGALALGVGMAATVAVGVKELGEMQKASAQTEAVLKSTGGAANVTKRQVEGLAGALARKSGLDDQAIQQGQNLLLTFTNIRNEAGRGNDVFNQSTRILTDMSVAMGSEPKQAAIQLGKALNDPVKGITALSKVGVSFTQQQKDQIKSLVASGKSMKAQKIILAELNKEFGGSAAAYGQTLPGMIGRVKEAFSGAAATIVSAFLPAIVAGANRVSELVAKMQAWASSDKGQAQLADLRSKLEQVGNAIGNVIGFMVKHRGAMMSLTAAVLAGVVAYKAFMIVKAVSTAVQTALVLFKAWRLGTLALTISQMGLNAALIANPIGLIVVGLAALAAGLIVAYKKCDTFRAIVNGTFSWIKRHWPLILTILLGPIGLAVVGIIKHWDKIKSATSGMYSWVVSKLGAMVGYVSKLPGRISSATSGMWNGLKDAFRSALNWVIEKWNSFELKLTLPKKLGGGSIGIDTPNLPMMARGGRVTQPSIIGEDGDEQIVPLSSKYRKDGIRNLLEAAAAMGVPMYAAGRGARGTAKPATAKKAPPKLSTADRIAAGNAQFAALRERRDRAFAPLDQALAIAEGTPDPTDDVGVIRKMIDWANRTKTLVSTFKVKAPGIGSAALANDRTRTTTEMIRQVNQYNDQIKQLTESPATDDPATDTGATSDGTDGGMLGGDGGADAASGAPLTGVDIRAVFGDAQGSGRAYVNAAQAAPGQSVTIQQTFTGEPNMAAAAQSAAWSFTTIMANAPGAAA